jgi:hypothetical protein
VTELLGVHHVALTVRDLDVSADVQLPTEIEV